MPDCGSTQWRVGQKPAKAMDNSGAIAGPLCILILSSSGSYRLIFILSIPAIWLFSFYFSEYEAKRNVKACCYGSGWVPCPLLFFKHCFHIYACNSTDLYYWSKPTRLVLRLHLFACLSYHKFVSVLHRYRLGHCRTGSKGKLLVQVTLFTQSPVGFGISSV
jgi:hypothetical protein